MALVLGTNAGFVTAEPTLDPGGASNLSQDGAARAMKHTIPAGKDKITKVGWYHGNTSAAGDYEIGLYAHDSGSDLPGALLYSTIAVSSGTTEGWKSQAVDWDVVPETTYWIAVQLDSVSGASNIDYVNTSSRVSIDVAISTLKNPWVSDGVTDPQMIAIFGLVDASAEYVDISGTITGTSELSGALEVSSVVDLSGTIAGTSALSGALTIAANWQATGYDTTRRIVAAGNDSFYYEDI